MVNIAPSAKFGPFVNFVLKLELVLGSSHSKTDLSFIFSHTSTYIFVFFFCLKRHFAVGVVRVYIFKLRQGASISHFVGWLVGWSVGWLVCRFVKNN